jgi:hypothetical protein
VEPILPGRLHPPSSTAIIIPAPHLQRESHLGNHHLPTSFTKSAMAAVSSNQELDIPYFEIPPQPLAETIALNKLQTVQYSF